MTDDLELTSPGLVPRAQVNALLSKWKERILAGIGKAVATSGEEVMAIGKTIGDVVTLAQAQFDQLRTIGAELDPTRAVDVTNIARVLDRHDKELTAFIAEFGRKLSDNDERIRSVAGMSREILAIGGQVGEVSLQARLLSVKRTSLESGGDHVSQILALSQRALSHLQFQDPMVQDLLEIEVQIAAMAAEEGFDCPARPGLSRIGAQQRLATDEVGQAPGEVVLF